MLFSYNWLQEFINTELPAPEKLAELLALHVFEVDGIEKKQNDYIFDVAILPQRGDCLSHEGLAREIAAIAKKEFKEVERASTKPQKGLLTPLKVSIASKKNVLRYAAFIVEDVTIAPSPQWMQERLELFGVNSINNVVDITNYVMLEVGQPLHAFDYSAIQGHTMTIRESKQNEALVLLDEHELILPKGTLIIEDSKTVIDLAGIKGGKATGISNNTKHIVFQAATFSRQKIYQTKKMIGYSTTASEIYSHGVDPNLAKKALERAMFLLQKYGGGKVVQAIDIYPIKKKAVSVNFNPHMVEKILGVSIKEPEIKSILKRLTFLVRGKTVLVPTFRQDVSIPEDIVEEIGRMYGYENIEPLLPKAELAVPKTNYTLYWEEQIRNVFKEVGFTEVYNYSFAKKGEVELQNPISQEFAYLRSDLLQNLLRNVEANEHTFKGKDIKLFEIGKVFIHSQKGAQEEKKLGGVYSPSQFSKEAFYIIKGVLDLLTDSLGVEKIWYNENEQGALLLNVNHREIGFIKELKTPRQSIAFEIDFDVLIEKANEKKEYSPPLKYPAVLRDLALFVPSKTKAQDVVHLITTEGGEFIGAVDLFDVYESKEALDNKKSLAFHIAYQAKDRTLTNKEVDTIQRNILQAIEKNEFWKVR